MGKEQKPIEEGEAKIVKTFEEQPDLVKENLITTQEEKEKKQKKEKLKEAKDNLNQAYNKAEGKEPEPEPKPEPEKEKIEIETGSVQADRYKEELERLTNEREEITDSSEDKDVTRLRDVNGKIIELKEKLKRFDTEPEEENVKKIEETKKIEAKAEGNNKEENWLDKEAIIDEVNKVKAKRGEDFIDERAIRQAIIEKKKKMGEPFLDKEAIQQAVQDVKDERLKKSESELKPKKTLINKEKPESKAETTEVEKKDPLDDARKNFARFELKAKKWVGEQKKLKVKKDKNDFEGYKNSKENYFKTIKTHRVEMYEKALKEIGKLGFSEKEADKEMRKRMEEIIKETITGEAIKLYDQKMDLKLGAKSDSKIEKAKAIAGKMIGRYRKMPLKHKIMLSAGLFAGGIVAGAAGGTTGAALATGLVAGRWFQRTLGGAATAVGLEGLIKKSQEKKSEKETLKELSDGLLDKIKNNDKKLDEKLLKLEGSKNKQKYSRYMIAGATGALIASGWTSKALANVIPDEWSNWAKGKLGLKETGLLKASESASKSEILPELDEKIPKEAMTKVVEAPKLDPERFIEVASKGDSIWKMAEDQLSNHYHEEFTELNQARKTYLIDLIKDKIAVDPKAFGLEDIDKLKVGQKIDFSSIFEGTKMLEIDAAFDEAEGLEKATIENIGKNNSILEKWVKEHPQGQLTSEKVDEILSGGKAEKIAETFSPEKQKELYKNFLESYKFSPYEERAMQMLGLTPQDYLTKFDKIEVGKLLENKYKSEILGADKRFIKYISELIKIHGLEGEKFLSKMTIGGFLKMFG